MSALQDLRAELLQRYSYVQVLAWAVALTNRSEFSGDTGAWSKLIQELRGEFPDLLDGIWFSERGFSEQVEDFFRVMARSGVLSFANPRYERITLSEDAQQSLSRNVPTEIRSKVEAIAARLAELATR